MGGGAQGVGSKRGASEAAAEKRNTAPGISANTGTQGAATSRSKEAREAKRVRTEGGTVGGGAEAARNAKRRRVWGCIARIPAIMMAPSRAAKARAICKVSEETRVRGVPG